MPAAASGLKNSPEGLEFWACCGLVAENGRLLVQISDRDKCFGEGLTSPVSLGLQPRIATNRNIRSGRRPSLRPPAVALLAAPIFMQRIRRDGCRRKIYTLRLYDGNGSCSGYLPPSRS